MVQKLSIKTVHQDFECKMVVNPLPSPKRVKIFSGRRVKTPKTSKNTFRADTKRSKFINGISEYVYHKISWNAVAFFMATARKVIYHPTRIFGDVMPSSCSCFKTLLFPHRSQHTSHRSSLAPHSTTFAFDRVRCFLFLLQGISEINSSPIKLMPFLISQIENVQNHPSKEHTLTLSNFQIGTLNHDQQSDIIERIRAAFSHNRSITYVKYVFCLLLIPHS
jgi:hypothetical protein